MSKSAVLPAQMPSAPTQALDQHEQEQLALINSSMGTVYHFFGGFIPLCRPIHDPRHPSFTIYPLPAVCFAALSMFLCRWGSRRQINPLFSLLIPPGPPSPARVFFTAVTERAPCLFPYLRLKS